MSAELYVTVVCLCVEICYGVLVVFSLLNRMNSNTNFDNSSSQEITNKLNIIVTNHLIIIKGECITTMARMSHFENTFRTNTILSVFARRCFHWVTADPPSAWPGAVANHLHPGSAARRFRLRRHHQLKGILGVVRNCRQPTALGAGD